MKTRKRKSSEKSKTKKKKIKIPKEIIQDPYGFGENCFTELGEALKDIYNRRR